MRCHLHGVRWVRRLSRIRDVRVRLQGGKGCVRASGRACVHACVRACMRPRSRLARLRVCCEHVRACVRAVIREASAWAGGHKYANERTGQAGGLPGGRAGQDAHSFVLPDLVVTRHRRLEQRFGRARRLDEPETHCPHAHAPSARALSAVLNAAVAAALAADWLKPRTTQHCTARLMGGQGTRCGAARCGMGCACRLETCSTHR